MGGGLATLRRAAILGSLVALWPASARALDPTKAPAQYVARSWQQSQDGLPQNFVGGVAQTTDGYLWLSTQEGLVRFDGSRFVVYTTRDVPALKTNDLLPLLVDGRGALWIGTRGGGVTRRDPDGTFRTMRASDGLASDFVLALFEAKDGAVWVGTRGGGASRVKGDTIESWSTKTGLAGDVVTSFAELRDGTIAIGTESGLSRMDGAGHFTTTRDELTDPAVRALLADADGTLWIGTDGGLDRWQEGALTAFKKEGGPSDPVRALYRDRDGNLWIGEQSGLHRLSSRPGAAGTMTSFGALSSLDTDGVHPLEMITSLHEDTEGNLWIGQHSHGLLRLQDGKVTTFGTTLIWAIYEDARGSMWLGGGDGLYAMRGDALWPFADPTRLSNTNVWAIAEAPDGALWLGTEAHGVVAYAGGKYSHVSTLPEMTSGSTRVVFRARDGTMWLGMNDGVARWKDGALARFGPAEGAPRMPVNGFAEEADGRLWVASDAGVLEWKDGRFALHDARAPSSTVSIMTLAIDGDDMWAGTYGGGVDLLRDGEVVGRITTKEGLFNDVVYGIVDDGRGELWMTCNKGIFHARKSDLVAVATKARATLTSTALGTSDGMRSGECNSGQPAAIRAKDGKLWFPTAAGAVRIDPAHMRKNEVVPPVRIEEVAVDRAPIDLASSPELPAGSKDFAFVYTALSFTAPERVRFKYMLEGFDRDWVDAGARRVAYYTNLEPGKYRFRVIAANDDGVWNTKGADVAFKLLPRFWQTIPFYLACAFGLMLAGAGSVRLRLLQLRERARELEKKVDERTRELAKVNLDLKATFEALAEKDERLHEDLLQAQAFQQRILPRIPGGGPLRIRTLYKPADLVGGDIYDVCEMGDGRTRVFMADTTGHGVQASLRTMVLKTEYDRIKSTSDSPGAALAELNKKIVSVYPGLEMRCSACCFDVTPLDDGGATVRYANAAHPPLLRASGSKVDEVYASGTFLGMVHDVAFREVEVRLAERDLLLAYTDGICEQEDAGGRAFGVERMIELLGAGARDAEDALKTLDAELAKFAAGRPMDDDVAMVCIECLADRRSREVVR